MAYPKALVLSGGSIKGAFQAGAVPEIVRHGFTPDAIYGVSVGALNGAFLTDRVGRRVAAGTTPIPWDSVADELEQFWRTRITSFKAIAKKRTASALAGALFSNFNGIISTNALRDLVHQELDPARMGQSGLYFAAGSVELVSGGYVSAHLGFPNLVEYVIASTAIPIVMPITRIGHQLLLDGGVRNVAPLAEAIANGATEIVCVACQPRDVGGADFDRENLLQLADRLLDIVVNEIVNNDIDLAESINVHCPTDGTPVASGPLAGKRYVKLTVIRPVAPLQISLEKFKPADIARLIEAGHLAARTEMLRAGYSG